MNIRFGFILKTLAAVVFSGGAVFLQAQTFQLSPIQRLTNGENLITVTTPTRTNYDILISSNLVQWNALITALSTNSSIQHTDSAAPFLPFRFYKAEQLTNAAVVTGDHVPTDAGDIIIHKGYHASFAMSWNHMMIYIDPTNSFPELPRADLVFLTHDHTDHYSVRTITNVIRGPNAMIVAPPRIYTNSGFTSLKSITTVLTNGVSTNLLGIDIQAVPMYNTNPSPPHVKGVGNGYVLGMGGKRIYVSGDTVNIPEMRDLGAIDVAFLAMNQPYTMTVAQAVDAVRMFVPKVVYPEHYRGTPTTDLGSFKQQVMTNPCVEVRLRNWY